MPVIYSWFSNTVPSNPLSPASYAKIPGTPSCEGTEEVCAIYAQVDPNNTNRPLIPQTLQNEITTALNQEDDTANVLLRS